MSPPAPTPLPASSTHFSLQHPIKLMTLRPNTWFALETLIEFIVVSYLVWALFYLFYLWICGAIWVTKGVKDAIERRRGGRKWREERKGEKDKEPGKGESRNTDEV